jgi:hypothetical protein
MLPTTQPAPVLDLIPQSDPQKIPRGYGPLVLVSIQHTFIPLVRRIRKRQDYHDIVAVIHALGIPYEAAVSWNQTIWVPHNFGLFLTQHVFRHQGVCDETVIPQDQILKTYIHPV